MTRFWSSPSGKFHLNLDQICSVAVESACDPPCPATVCLAGSGFHPKLSGEEAESLLRAMAGEAIARGLPTPLDGPTSLAELRRLRATERRLLEWADALEANRDKPGDVGQFIAAQLRSTMALGATEHLPDGLLRGVDAECEVAGRLVAGGAEHPAAAGSRIAEPPGASDRLRVVERIRTAASAALTVAGQARYWICQLPRRTHDRRLREARRMVVDAVASLSIACAKLMAVAEDAAEGMYTAHCGHRFPLDSSPTCPCDPGPA